MRRRELIDVAMGRSQADLVVEGGTLVNVNTAELYQADVAVKGDRIAAVGDVSYAKGSETRVVDATGKHLSPGLVDGHCHLYGLGADLDNINVRDTATAAAAADLVAAAAKTRTDEWLIGRGWDQNKWPRASFPTRWSPDFAPRR